MEIDVDEYLSFEDKRRIASDVFEQVYRRALDNQYFTENLALYIVTHLINKKINELFGSDEAFEDKIIEKVLKAVNELGSFTVFYESSHSSFKSEPRKLVDKIVRDNSGLLEKKVVEAIQNTPKKMILEVSKEVLLKKLLK